MLERDIRRLIVAKARPHCLVTAVESSDTGGKMPDLFIRSSFLSWWVELKQIPTPGRKIPWRPGQENWIRRYRQLSGSFALVLAIKEELFVFKFSGKQSEKELPPKFGDISSARFYATLTGWSGYYKYLPKDIWEYTGATEI